MNDVVTRVWDRSSAWRPIVVGMLFALVASLSFLQWRRPFLEHDDWDMLLPDGPHFVVIHAQRVLHEGRWLNYWWWLAGSSHLSPTGAVILFTLGWVLVAAVLARALNIGWWSAPAVVALYAIPMVSDISYWPATLAAPTWALAITLLALWLTRGKRVPHLVVVFLGTVVISLGYPTFALFVPAFLLALHHRRSMKWLTALGVTFGFAYIAGIITIFTLNAARFGYFGIRINPSRRPTPLNSLPALRHHLDTVIGDWHLWWSVDALPLIAGLICLVVAARESALRRRLVILGLLFVGAGLLNSAATITNGAYTPLRAMGWTWLFLVLVLVWGLEASRGHVRMICAGLLVAVAAWSTAYWAHGAIERYHHAGALTIAESRIMQLWNHNHPTVIVYAPPKAPVTPGEFQTMTLLANGLAKAHGIWPAAECIRCHQLQRYIREHRLQQQAAFMWNDLLIVNFPHWLVMWVHLTQNRVIAPFA
ncbi:MAG: hypothetical protein ACTHJM_06555 [Marmoricola sp.]